jgi:hypothetical protein
VLVRWPHGLGIAYAHVQRDFGFAGLILM